MIVVFNLKSVRIGATRVQHQVLLLASSPCFSIFCTIGCGNPRIIRRVHALIQRVVVVDEGAVLVRQNLLGCNKANFFGLLEGRIGVTFQVDA